MKSIALFLGLFSLNSFASQNNDKILIVNKTHHQCTLQCMDISSESINQNLAIQKIIEPRKYYHLRLSQSRPLISLTWHGNNEQKNVVFSTSNVHSITIYSDESDSIAVDVNAH